jgi:hypothetical protein
VRPQEGPHERELHLYRIYWIRSAASAQRNSPTIITKVECRLIIYRVACDNCTYARTCIRPCVPRIRRRVYVYVLVSAVVSCTARRRGGEIEAWPDCETTKFRITMISHAYMAIAIVLYSPQRFAGLGFSRFQNSPIDPPSIPHRSPIDPPMLRKFKHAVRFPSPQNHPSTIPKANRSLQRKHCEFSFLSSIFMIISYLIYSLYKFFFFSNFFFFFFFFFFLLNNVRDLFQRQLSYE